MLFERLEALADVVARDQHVFCTLQLVSKSLKLALADVCRGRVIVTFEANNQNFLSSFERWLGKNAELLDTLSVRAAAAAEEDENVLQMVDAAVARGLGLALHAASQQGSNLRIRSVLLPHLSLTNTLVLSQLRHFQGLEHLEAAFHAADMPGSAAVPVACALAALTSLRSVSLMTDQFTQDSDSDDNDDGLALSLLDATPVLDVLCVAALPMLTKLTCLHLGGLVWPMALQHLPASLRQLHLPPQDVTFGDDPMHISHLTQLARLVCGRNIRINDGSNLPSNLQLVAACQRFSTAPLKPLQWLSTVKLLGNQFGFHVPPQARVAQLMSLCPVRLVEWQDDESYMNWWRQTQSPSRPRGGGSGTQHGIGSGLTPGSRRQVGADIVAHVIGARHCDEDDRTLSITIMDIDRLQLISDGTARQCFVYVGGGGRYYTPKVRVLHLDDVIEP